MMVRTVYIRSEACGGWCEGEGLRRTEEDSKEAREDGTREVKMLLLESL